MASSMRGRGPGCGGGGIVNRDVGSDLASCVIRLVVKTRSLGGTSRGSRLRIRMYLSSMVLDGEISGAAVGVAEEEVWACKT